MLDQFTAFHFLRPQCLWLLMPAALLYLIVLRREDVSKRWKDLIAPELLDELIVGRHRRWRFRPVHATCLAIALAAVGMVGPTWTREQPPFTDKAPLVIALDLSREMDAIDVQPTRLERAKLKIHDLMKLRAGSRTSLFVYAADAHLVLPLTTDESLMDLYTQSLSTNLIPEGPKDTAGALRKIDAFLKDETVPGTILFITCGVERKALPAFTAHNGEARHQILVLGIGTSEGGPLRAGSGQFVTENGRRVFSKLDLDQLKALKDQADIPTSTVTFDDDDVEWVQRHAISHLQAVQKRDAQVRWVDQGYWLVIPVAFLTALWFRKGWTVRWTTACFALVCLFQAPLSKAADFHLQNFRFADLWLTADQQGRYYYEKGDYATAAERFHDPMWKGIAFCKNKNYEEALNQFALLDTAESWFNQGNALAYLKKYPEAVHAYSEALRERPRWREAEDNLNVVRSLIPPPLKNKNEEQQYDPNLKPDEVKFDKRGKKGKKGQMNVGKEQMADIWMRNIQTSPADFLRRKFEIEAAAERTTAQSSSMPPLENGPRGRRK
jgi:Ca-activated chloride channel family protein